MNYKKIAFMKRRSSGVGVHGLILTYVKYLKITNFSLSRLLNFWAPIATARLIFIKA